MKSQKVALERFIDVLDSWEKEWKLLRDVADAAAALVEAWRLDEIEGDDIPLDNLEAALVLAVRALPSPDEDRGVRDPGTPGEQEAGPEQAHEPDPHA